MMKNNCSSKKNFFLRVILFLLSLMFVPLDNTYAAYASISLNPASGTIATAGTNINIVVNSGTDNFIGLNMDVEFSGALDFVSAAVVEASKCGNNTLNTHVSAGSNNSTKLSISCLSMAGEKYNGPVVTLKFKSKGTGGSSTFKLSTTDSTHGSTLTGGTYTLATASTSTGGGSVTTGGMGGGGTDTNNPSDLPKAGILDNVSQKIIIGSSLMIMALLLSVLPAILPKIIASTKSETVKIKGAVSANIKALVMKQKEISVKKRRGKLEGKF